MVRSLGNGWKTSFKNGFEAQILSFDEPSEYGINEGRISKLWIRDNKNHKTVCNYDRGWDVEPTAEVLGFYNEIIAKFN